MSARTVYVDVVAPGRALVTASDTAGPRGAGWSGAVGQVAGERRWYAEDGESGMVIGHGRPPRAMHAAVAVLAAYYGDDPADLDVVVEVERD